jgi:hypothetical protein
MSSVAEEKTTTQNLPNGSNNVKSTTSTTLTTLTTTSNSTEGINVTTNNTTYRLPSALTLQNASKLAVVEDKPIMMDYWTYSLDRRALIGIRENGEKLLVKSAEEYTSAISKFYRSCGEYIIVTENSIYITSSEIPNRRIS